MLNIGGLNEGFVLDHIEAGKAMMIYNNLGPVSYTHLDVYKRQRSPYKTNYKKSLL